MRPEVVRDIFKKVKITRVTCLHGKKFGDRNVSNDKSDYWRGKRKIGEVVRSFELRVDETIRKAIDCQQAEAKRSYRGFVTVVKSIIIIILLVVLFGRVSVFILVFVLCYCFHVIILHESYVKFMFRCCIMNHPRCGDFAFSASFL